MYKSDDATLKELGIKSAPVVIGMDRYGNEWLRPSALTQSGIRDLCGLLPDVISKYEDQLAKAFELAKAREEKGDERGALLAYRKIAMEGKKGYGPIATAREKMNQLGEKRLRDAVTLMATNEKDGQQELANIIRDFPDSLFGARARFALIRCAIDQSGDVRARIPEIQRMADLDGDEVASVAKDAKDLLLYIESYGESLIAYALRKAKRGDAEAARSVLRRVATDFPGLKAARQANEEIARL
jgi:TolA-binding protein